MAVTTEQVLQGLQTVLSGALQGRSGVPDVQVYIDSQPLPYTGSYPYLVLNELNLYTAWVFGGTGGRGSPDGRPDQYTAKYYQTPASDETGQTLGDVLQQRRRDLDDAVGSFSTTPNDRLNLPGILWAGQDIAQSYADPYADMGGDVTQTATLTIDVMKDAL